MYGEVSPAFDALRTFLESPGIEETDYWYDKVQVCHCLPGAGKMRKGGIQVQALVLVADVKFKKKACKTLSDCKASHSL